MGSHFSVRSNCPFTLTRLTHNGVECEVTIRWGDSGLLVHVEIIINKIQTVLRNGNILVETKSVSLPYNHTYQHIFQYGIYTKLRSSLLAMYHLASCTQRNRHSVEGTLTDFIKMCYNTACRLFFFYTLDCLQSRMHHYIQLSDENMCSYEMNEYIRCAFFKEVVQLCKNNRYVWNIWRSVAPCEKPTCPGDLLYLEQGTAFPPSCSNPNPRPSTKEHISSCACPAGKHCKVLNDCEDSFHCVGKSSCPCIFASKNYLAGDIRSTNCHTCLCDSGKWRCSKNFCPARCLIEGQFLTTIDGKQYMVPGKCKYVASQGNFSSLPRHSQITCFQEVYTFSHRMVKVGEEIVIRWFFWESSMYVQVHTSFGLKIQVLMSPEIKLYISPPSKHTSIISGLCGNSNNDTMDDFTTSSGIIESSAQTFALSWSLCNTNTTSMCIFAEIFADEKCSVLNNPTGIFAMCHGHNPTDHYHTVIFTRCLQQCECVALGSYAKACANLDVVVGDWKTATNCIKLSYSMQACNQKCRFLFGPDPRRGPDNAPVEGCGCLEGTHLNQGYTCTPKAERVCHYNGCRNGKVCVHCAAFPVNTAKKTCDSLSKPMGVSMTCDSGCYCPHDHLGNCVSLENCTCVYNWKVFSAGQSVKTNCETCICGWGQWQCKDEPCSGKCEVYGNGHYQTFDSKWYHFDGHFQYTLVEDTCGNRNGTFCIRVESIPCCDEACSRSIVLDLQVNGFFFTILNTN
uniref:VWFD domain-containing protein n=1 Tax=Mola mola TaxID=94237 RepID=A0A3Q3W8H4_MOLML